MAMLEVKNIVTKYGNVVALKGVSFSVEKGEIVSLIGANGAGKSTTLRAISGLVKCVDGEITFEGLPIHNLAPKKIVGNYLIHCPEGRQVFGRMTVEENLKLGAYARITEKDPFEQMKRVFDLFPRLLERKKQPAKTLSGGEQQMLAIGRAMMAKPKLLLLDEPSLGLAPNIVDLVFSVIKQLNKEGTTILLVEQNANKALKISDRAYVLEVGEVITSGAGQELLKDPKVKTAYLGGE